MNSKTIAALADHLSSCGLSVRVEGDGSRSISSVAAIDEAGPSDITFLANLRYEKQLHTTQAGAVIVSEKQSVPDGLTVLRVRDPYEANARLMVFLHGYRRHPFSGVSSGAHIDESASIGDNAAIAPGATIAGRVAIGRNAVIYPGCYVGEGARLGDDCVLYPNVVIYDGCVLGDRVAIHACTVIGEDGLGYAPVGERWHKIPAIGTVEIGDDVEIGANCSIDRATIGRTVIASGTKFSNLITIGHGTKVGENCMFVAQVGLAGSVTVGRHVMMAGKSGAAGHLVIGDEVRVSGMTGVMKDVPRGTQVYGMPAREMGKMQKVVSVYFRLPELRDRVRQLERELSELRAQLADRASSK